MMSPTDVLAMNVRVMRAGYGISRKELANRVNRHLPAAKQWSLNTVADVEGVRSKIRQVGVDELIALSCAFDVSPVRLLVHDGQIEVGEREFRDLDEFMWSVIQLPREVIDWKKNMLKKMTSEWAKRLVREAEGMQFLRAGTEEDWFQDPRMAAAVTLADAESNPPADRFGTLIAEDGASVRLREMVHEMVTESLRDTNKGED